MHRASGRFLASFAYKLYESALYTVDSYLCGEKVPQHDVSPRHTEATNLALRVRVMPWLMHGD